jgi:hypothetical protein
MRFLALAAAGLLLAACHSGPAATTAHPPVISSTTAPEAPSPPPRYYAAVAFDQVNQEAVLFGGVAGVFDETLYSDTWTWHASRWQRHDLSVHPTARDLAAMAFDPISRRSIMFGGEPDSGETWAWDGSSWKQLEPRNSPSPRSGVLMAFDPALGRLLLFGGTTGLNTLLYDTWEWDGGNWIKLPIPDATFAGLEGGLGYDPITKRMMLMGLGGGVGNDRKNWFLEPKGWVAQRFSNTAVPFTGFTLSTDSSGRLVLFGGSNSLGGRKGFGATNDTWAWDGSDWILRTVRVAPSARWQPASVVDSTTGDVVLFGGIAQDGYRNLYALDDTWTWDGSAWTQRSPLRATGLVQALFVVAVMTPIQPPADEIFELRLNRPDGTRLVTHLCAHTKLNPCDSEFGYVWTFPPSKTGFATYSVLYGRGAPDFELSGGVVDMLHSRTYYLEYNG